jgi:hypothetical protein
VDGYTLGMPWMYTKSYNRIAQAYWSPDSKSLLVAGEGANDSGAGVIIITLP